MVGYARAVWLAAGLGLVVFVVFGVVLRFGWTGYDEFEQVIFNPIVRGLSWSNLAAMFTQRVVTSYYPVRLLSFAIDDALWGLDPLGFHLTNLLIHAANVLLIFTLVRFILSNMYYGIDDAMPDGRGPDTAGLLAGLVFGLHPVVVEPVAWVAGREELLMTMFALVVVHGSVRGTVARSRMGPAGRLMRSRLIVGTAALAASWCNAVAVVLPMIVLGYDLGVARERSGKRLLARTWYLWLIAGVTFGLKVTGPRAGMEVRVVDRVVEIGAVDRVLTVFNTFGLNIRTLLWPDGLTLIYPDTVPRSPMEAGVWIGVVALGLVVWLMGTSRAHPVVRWALFWFLVALLPTAQLWPHPVFRADRYLYLPLAGLAIAGAVALTHGVLTHGVLTHGARTLRPRLVFGVLAGVVVLGLAVQSRRQLMIWSDRAMLFEHCVAVNPASAKAHINLGAARVHAGQPREAVSPFAQAIQLTEASPGARAMAHLGLGNAYLQMARYDDAIRQFTAALGLVEKLPEALSNRASAYVQTGRFELARADLDRAVAWGPDNPLLYYNRALLHRRLGEWARAREDLKRAMELDPHGPTAQAAIEALETMPVPKADVVR